MKNMPSLERPIFIVGPGRSGTTLMRSLLSAHSRIAVTPETHFMSWAEQRGLEQGAPQDFEAFWEDYKAWTRFQDLEVDAAQCRELIERQGENSFRAIFHAVLLAYRAKAGKERVGEKTPGHTRFLSKLLSWYPDAQVIVMSRDPKAVVASQLRTHYVRKRLGPISLRHGIVTGNRTHEIAYYADDWTKIFTEHLAPWHGDPRFHRVHYEALVQNPEREMRAICSFLDEPYEPAMLTRRTSEEVHPPAGAMNDEKMEEWRQKHHAQSRAPISTDSLDKWKHHLSGVEVAMIEGQCNTTMRRLGYTPSTSTFQRTLGRSLTQTVLATGRAEKQSRAVAKEIYQRIRARTN
jgi:hypothetical protein